MSWASSPTPVLILWFSLLPTCLITTLQHQFSNWVAYFHHLLTFLVLVVLVLGRWSTTWATPPDLFALLIFQVGSPGFAWVGLTGMWHYIWPHRLKTTLSLVLGCSWDMLTHSLEPARQQDLYRDLVPLTCSSLRTTPQVTRTFLTKQTMLLQTKYLDTKPSKIIRKKPVTVAHAYGASYMRDCRLDRHPRPATGKTRRP
jgi:hypothetical protein